MACCGAAREASWVPSVGPLGVLSGYQVGGLLPALGTVETSAGASCCDACASRRKPEASCESGVCGVPHSAGVALPLTAAGAVDPSALAQSWGRAIGVRQAGEIPTGVLPVQPVRAAFRASNVIDLRRLDDAELYERETDLREVEFTASTPESTRAAYRTELAAVRVEGDRRTAADPGEAAPGDEEPPTAAEWERKREQVARTTAAALAPGDDAASARRRDAIIAQAVNGTFESFNAYLEREYRARVESIHGDTAITLARLHNEDREADRTYRLALARLNAASGGGSSESSGSGAAAPVIGLGLLFLLARSMGGA